MFNTILFGLAFVGMVTIVSFIISIFQRLFGGKGPHLSEDALRRERQEEVRTQIKQFEAAINTVFLALGEALKSHELRIQMLEHGDQIDPENQVKH